MTLTLLLSIAIPSFLMMLNLWSGYSLRAEMNERFNKVDDRFNKVDDRFDKVDLRHDSIRAEMTQLRDSIRAEMTQLRDSIHRDMVTLHERVAVVESQNR